MGGDEKIVHTEKETNSQRLDIDEENLTRESPVA